MYFTLIYKTIHFWLISFWLLNILSPPLLLLHVLIISQVNGIIFFQGRTTACDTCDRISTNSVRNIGCCLKFSKCCLPDTLDEYNTRVAYEDMTLFERPAGAASVTSSNSKRSNRNNNNKQQKQKKKKQVSKKSTTTKPPQPKFRVINFSW